MQSLEQAQEAARWGDWEFVQHYLQQILMDSERHQSFPQQNVRAQPEQMFGLALEAFEAGDFRDRWELAKLFPRFVQLGLPAEAIAAPLVALLQNEDEDPELRWFAARILGEFRHVAVLMTLINLLQNQSPDADLQEMVASAIAGFGEMAIAPITPLLSNPATRRLAVKTLSQIRHSATLSALLSVLHDPDANLRAVVLEALGSFHDARVAPVLIQALTDEEAMVRRVAVSSLGFRSDLLPSMDLIGILQPLLWDPHPVVGQQTAIALGRLGTDAAVTALQAVLQSSQTILPLKIEAVRALGWMNTATAIQVLQQLLQDPTEDLSLAPSVSREIVVVLGRIDRADLKPLAARTLRTILQSQHPITLTATGRQAIAFSLGNLGQRQSIDSLIQLLADGDARVRLHAISALKQLDSDSTRQQLQSLMTSATVTGNLKKGVAIALQEWN